MASFVQVCASWITNTDGTASCSSWTWTQAYLLPPEAEGQIDLLIQGGFSPNLFGVGFTGTLTLFAIGFGIGVVVSQLRKLRIR